MKVTSIVIVLERESSDQADHATELTFRDGLWSANGPVYSRISSGLHEIGKILRGVKD